MQTKEVTVKMEQSAVPSSQPSPTSTIPSNAWLIVAIGMAFFLLLIGLRIFKSKRVVIDTPKVDIECDGGDTKKEEKPK